LLLLKASKPFELPIIYKGFSKKILEKSCARPIDEKAQRLRSTFFTISYLPLALNYILFYHKLYVNV